MSSVWLIVLFLTLVTAYLIGVVVSLQSKLRKGKLAEERFKELESKVDGLELQSIRQTLNPHLFRNTLNAIQSHAYQTYYTLDKLAGVLDYILYESNQHSVSVKEEIDFALNLIEINRLKVSPLFDLRIKQQVDPDNPAYTRKNLAPLVTVDLIENAFKHTDLQRANAFISILFELKENQFSLTVSNTISSTPQLRKPKGGLGKENFKKRLEILYKENFALDQFIQDEVYITRLKINLSEHNTQMLAS
ncbi:MAG: histidine kinase [Marivirga sp.]|nr:histidine kinase [Marivirga sp.]